MKRAGRRLLPVVRPRSPPFGGLFDERSNRCGMRHRRRVARRDRYGRGLHALGEKGLGLGRNHQIVGRNRVISRLQMPGGDARHGPEGGAVDRLLLFGQLRAFRGRHVADENMRERGRIDRQETFGVRMNRFQTFGRRPLA